MTRLPPSLRGLGPTDQRVQICQACMERGVISPEESLLLGTQATVEIALAIQARNNVNTQAQELEFPEGTVLSEARIREFQRVVNPPITEFQQGIIDAMRYATGYTVTEDEGEDMENEELVTDLLTPSATPAEAPKIRKSFLKGTATVEDMTKACYELGKNKTDAEKAAINKHFEWIAKRGMLLGVQVGDMPAITFAKNQVPIWDRAEIIEKLMAMYNTNKNKLDAIMERNKEMYAATLKKFSASAKALLKEEVSKVNRDIKAEMYAIEDLSASLALHYSKLSKYETNKAQAEDALKSFNENKHFDTLMSELKECPYVLYRIEGDVLYFYPREDCIIKYVNPSAGVNIECNFGRIGLKINFTLRSIRAVPLKNNLFTNDEEYYHPHISGSSICMGNATDILNRALVKRDLKTLLRTINDLLCQYNPGSPYRQLENFKDHGIRKNIDSIIPEIDYTPEEYQKRLDNKLEVGYYAKFIGPKNGNWESFPVRDKLIGRLLQISAVRSDNRIEVSGGGGYAYPRDWFEIDSIAKTINSYRVANNNSICYMKFKITPEAVNRAGLGAQYANRVFEIRSMNFENIYSTGSRIVFHACESDEGETYLQRYVYFDDVDFTIDQDSETERFTEEENA